MGGDIRSDRQDARSGGSSHRVRPQLGSHAGRRLVSRCPRYVRSALHVLFRSEAQGGKAASGRLAVAVVAAEASPAPIQMPGWARTSRPTQCRSVFNRSSTMLRRPRPDRANGLRLMRRRNFARWRSSLESRSRHTPADRRAIRFECE
jgi:hypothetical protein